MAWGNGALRTDGGDGVRCPEIPPYTGEGDHPLDETGTGRQWDLQVSPVGFSSFDELEGGDIWGRG